MLVAGLAGVLCCASAGCVGPRAPAQRAARVGGSSDPFAPASLRIEPITRIEADGSGGSTIELHVELTDRFGDNVKGIGVLRAQLLQVGSDLDRSAATRVASWEVDLTDPERNAAYYDPVTRTYRATLTGAPGWAASPGSGGRPLIRAVWVAPGAVDAALTDEYAPPQ